MTETAVANPEKGKKPQEVIEKNTGIEYECWAIDKVKDDGGTWSGRTGHPNFFSNAILRGDVPTCPECGTHTIRPAGPISPNIP